MTFQIFSTFNHQIPKSAIQIFCIFFAQILSWFVHTITLANFYVVKLSEKAEIPTEDGHEPLWVAIDEVENLLPLPYHKEGIRQYFAMKN